MAESVAASPAMTCGDPDTRLLNSELTTELPSYTLVIDDPLKDGVVIVKGEIVEVPTTSKFLKLEPD